MILTVFLNFSASTNSLPFTVIGLRTNYSVHLFFKRPPTGRKLNIRLSKLSYFHKHLHLNISGAKEFKDKTFRRFVNDKVGSIANTFREPGLQPSPERLHVNQVLWYHVTSCVNNYNWYSQTHIFPFHFAEGLKTTFGMNIKYFLCFGNFDFLTLWWFVSCSRLFEQSQLRLITTSSG